jgi:hypothetical protein
MRTLSRLIAAAGIVGAIAATGGTAAVAQGVYLQGPGFGVDGPAEVIRLGRPQSPTPGLVSARVVVLDPEIAVEDVPGRQSFFVGKLASP